MEICTDGTDVDFDAFLMVPGADCVVVMDVSNVLPTIPDTDGDEIGELVTAVVESGKHVSRPISCFISFAQSHPSHSSLILCVKNPFNFKSHDWALLCSESS